VTVQGPLETTWEDLAVGADAALLEQTQRRQKEAASRMDRR
jgi:hypothetical protein